MKKRMVMLLLAAALPLSGCISVLERSYEVVKPHTSQYWEDATSSALRAEDYQSLVNGLLMLIADQTDTGVVRMYGYEKKTQAMHDMECACAEVTLKDPLGAYLVDYVTYDCEENSSYYEMTVRFTYQKTPMQLRALTNATTAGALPELLALALKDGRSELAVKVDYMDLSAENIEKSIAAVMEKLGRVETEWSVQYYPDAGIVGDTRIVEIVWEDP